MMGKKHTLVILNPGHFHAALTLRERHPLIDDDIHVFAEDGPDVDNFVRLVHSFNDRPANPTCWTLYVYRGWRSRKVSAAWKWPGLRMTSVCFWPIIRSTLQAGEST